MKIIIPRVALGHKCQQGRKAWRKKRVEFVICKFRQPPPHPCRVHGCVTVAWRVVREDYFGKASGIEGTEIRILCDAVPLACPTLSSHRDCTGRENVSGVYRDTVTNPSIAIPSCVLRLYFFPFRRSASNFLLRSLIYFVNWYNCSSAEGVYEYVIQIIVANEQINYYFIIIYCILKWFFTNIYDYNILIYVVTILLYYY